MTFVRIASVGMVLNESGVVVTGAPAASLPWVDCFSAELQNLRQSNATEHSFSRKHHVQENTTSFASSNVQ